MSTEGLVTECGRCSSPTEHGDIRCPICGLALGLPTTERESVVIQVSRCEGCGAGVTYDAKARAPKCAFCGSVMHLEEIVDPVEQTEAYAPFTVSAQEAREALRSWLGSLGFFRPSDLKSTATLESLGPLYWVAWVFDADALVSWTADSDASAGRAAWAPHSGQAAMSFDNILVSGSRGLSQEETDFLIQGYDVGVLEDEPQGPSDMTVEQFDVQRSMARDRILAAAHQVAGARIASEAVPGSRARNVNVSLLLAGLTTRRLAFPAWVVAYRHEGKLYRVVLCGQDSRLVKGTAPYSWTKILLVAVGAIAAVSAVIATLALL